MPPLDVHWGQTPECCLASWASSLTQLLSHELESASRRMLHPRRVLDGFHNQERIANGVIVNLKQTALGTLKSLMMPGRVIIREVARPPCHSYGCR